MCDYPNCQNKDTKPYIVPKVVTLDLCDEHKALCDFITKIIGITDQLKNLMLIE